MILILCYLAHTIHLLQGLDVVVFTVLKRTLSEERDHYEQETEEKISKANFVTIYGQAHLLQERTLALQPRCHLKGGYGTEQGDIMRGISLPPQLLRLQCLPSSCRT